jgi:plasmid stability protein
MYFACMVALQIRDVPDDVRDALAARAAAGGQSLQGFLLDLVRREAGFERNRALLADLSWADGGGGTLVDVVGALDEARAGREPA